MRSLYERLEEYATISLGTQLNWQDDTEPAIRELSEKVDLIFEILFALVLDDKKGDLLK